MAEVVVGLLLLVCSSVAEVVVGLLLLCCAVQAWELVQSDEWGEICALLLRLVMVEWIGRWEVREFDVG